MSDLIFNFYNFLVVIGGGIATLWCNKMYEQTKSRPLLNCLPSVFTSLGLLGTFLSICYSLNGLGEVNPGAIDNTGKTLAAVKAAGGQGLDIMKIISELIPAFTSSIVGLLGALIVTIWIKIKFAKEEAEEIKQLKNKSPEEYIRDIAVGISSNHDMLKSHNALLKDLITLNKEQEEKNREYNAKLNDNISHQSEILKEFIDGFVSRMDDIFKQMHGAIQQQVLNFGEEQFNKTSQILTAITERLSNVSNDIINTQRQSVETMMSNTNTEITNISTSVTEVLGRMTEELQNSLSSLNTQQSERLNTIINNYDSLASKLSAQNTDFAQKVTENMQSEFAKVQAHNVQSLQQMVDLKNAYQEATSDVMANTLSMNEKVTDNLRESMRGFVTNLHETVTLQCNALGAAITSNIESLDKAYKFIESLVAEIRQNYDQAVLAYGDAVNVAHRTNESSEKAITATNKSLQAVESTNEKIADVLDFLTERQENIEQLTKQMNSVSSAIEQLQKLESTLNKISINR